MVKPHVGIKTQESSFFHAGIQVKACRPGGFRPALHCRAKPGAQDQRLAHCDVEGPLFGKRCLRVWSGGDSGSEDPRARAGDRTPAYGDRDLKKSIQDSPLEHRVQAARSLKGQYALRLVCRLLEVPRSTVLKAARSERDLTGLTALIEFNHLAFCSFGVTKMYKLLTRQRVVCTRSQVRSIYLKLGMLGKKPAARRKTTDSRHGHPRYPNLVWELAVVRPNQVWAADTLEFRIGSQRAFLALLLDIFTRLILGFAVSFNNDTLLTLETLEMALQTGKPEIHHSDQGKTYAAIAYIRALGPYVAVSMAAAGKAWENGFAERLNWTIESEEILLSEYETLQEARGSIESYVKLYNEQRIHQSLGYMTPTEALQAYARDQQTGGKTTL